MMKLLMVIQGRDAVASRYRALQYIPYLESRGWQVEVAPYASGLGARLGLISRAWQSDLVFVQKKRLPGWQLGCMKWRGARIVYDVDDAVMFRSSRHGERSSGTRARRFRVALRHADLVIAGNEYLAEMVGAEHPRVAIQPLPFELDNYSPRQRYDESSELVLGWIGGGKSLEFLQELTPVFESLGASYPNLKLKIVSDRFFELEKLPVIHKPWRESDEGADVASFDIGIAPLPDDEWSRGKCGTKLLQYFCSAVPAVASPVGVHTAMVGNEERGLLARDLKEWELALRRLIESAELRKQLGQAGLAHATEQHALDVLAPRFETLLRSALSDG